MRQWLFETSVPVLTCLIWAATWHASAQEIAIIVPNELANTEGDSVHEITRAFPTGFRLQSLTMASEFQDVPASSRWITAAMFRPDGNLRSGPFNRVWPSLTLRLSTTTRDLSSLSNVFAQNLGSDVTTVHEGPVTFSTANIGPQGGPKVFDYRVDFQPPFYYDPSRGNLLFDWYAPAPTGPMLGTGWDEHSYSSSLRWIGNLDPEAIVANLGDNGVTPTQFIFVPEPASMPLILIGAALLSGFRVRLRRPNKWP